ncbi:MAG: hypothetical protein ACI3ZC_06640 [Candidatus Cryptobacteroides sp.]
MASIGTICSCNDDLEDILAASGEPDKVETEDNQIAGILVQGTYNPYFGSFALPIGIQSNMLLTYAGLSQKDVVFPDSNPASEYDNQTCLTASDMQILSQGGNYEKLTIKNGDFLCDLYEGNAGKVYVTVNPSTVDCTGEQLTLVNSRDEESVVKLSALTRSEDLLCFGQTRAADNGFYEAAASFTDAASAREAMINIEPVMESAVKEALEGIFGNGSSGKSLISIPQTIYQQFDGLLPAYALKSTRTISGNDGNESSQSVLSQYSLACACFQPLSFSFLYDANLPNLPVATPLSGYEFDLSKFTFNVDAPKVTIDDQQYSFTLSDVSIDVTGNIQVKITVPNFIDYHDGTYAVSEKQVDVKITPADLENFLTELENSLNTSAGTWSDELSSQLENAINTLVDQIESQVNSALADLQGQVNEQIGDLLEDLKEEMEGAFNKTIGEVNGYIDIYNSIAGRINNSINSINSTLQPTILYKASDGRHYQLSNSSAIPTQFSIAGGDAITLLPTSCTGEFAVPAYRKFIGVTDVWKTDNPAVSAQNGDSNCAQIAKEANSQYQMCVPVRGDVRRVPLKISGKGYTYCIVYSAVDYTGQVSSQKFYLSIN